MIAIRGPAQNTADSALTVDLPPEPTGLMGAAPAVRGESNRVAHLWFPLRTSRESRRGLRLPRRPAEISHWSHYGRERTSTGHQELSRHVPPCGVSRRDVGPRFELKFARRRGRRLHPPDACVQASVRLTSPGAVFRAPRFVSSPPGLLRCDPECPGTRRFLRARWRDARCGGNLRRRPHQSARWSSTRPCFALRSARPAFLRPCYPGN